MDNDVSEIVKNLPVGETHSTATDGCFSHDTYTKLSEEETAQRLIQYPERQSTKECILCKNNSMVLLFWDGGRTDHERWICKECNLWHDHYESTY